MPRVTDRAPGRSRRPRRVGVVPSTRGAAMATVSPMGTFTNSTHRHEATSVRMPPSRSPSEPPAPDIAAYTPMARERLGPFGVGVLDQGQGGGRRDGAPDTLGHPGRDQPQLVGGEPTQERGGGEDDDADGEHPAPAEEVPAAPPEQEQPSEGRARRR